jgi:broad specificity phosphatase PhoE
MQVLLVRHALPLRSKPGEGSDPELSEAGLAQVGRLPTALDRFPVGRVVSSPQRRAVQTAAPVAAARELPVDIDDRFAEYDRDLPLYIPVEQIRAERPEEWARMASGHLPSAVDEDAFRARVRAGLADLVAAAGHDDTVAVFSHGGVINVLLHEILGTARLLSFPIDYASVTRLLFSRSGQATVVTVNAVEHVWDLLPRNLRTAPGPASRLRPARAQRQHEAHS